MEGTVPKVSVCVITYNQAKYIKQCIESLITQDCDFDYEIIVSDDCSTDNTREILEHLYHQYPEKIRIFIHEKNLGVTKNYLFLHEQAQGEYIAHVDGDDYYFSNKLSLQARYLDENKECNIVWHPMLLDNNSRVFNGYQQSGTNFVDLKFTQGDIIQYISVGKNSSKMYRKTVRDIDIPAFELVDYLVNVEQVQNGYGGYASNEPLGVYRVGVGISSSGDKTRIALRDTFLYLLKKYPKYRLEINTAALTYFIRDIFARRKSAKIFLHVWIKTFHP
ncbi:glycosyltransferase family 2 protein, partial [Escherichia coli]|nr:glycosyltransferase family 2 protein [Escherichia coli]EGG2043457.1 glycosyltransferase family 2 protein [Escherichia coli]